MSTGAVTSRATTAASFSPGSRFEILRHLGSGGMGVVYEAYDRELRELVALKTLHNARGQWLARFKREFRALHDLDHRNLVALGEFFDRDPEPFFSMELVRGVDFMAYVRGEDASTDQASRVDVMAPTEFADAGGSGALVRYPALAPLTAPGGATGGTRARLDEGRLRAALAQLAAGVVALHDAGLVHRDIKPSNVLVTGDGRVVVLDFGLVAEVGERTASSASAVVGTFDYMAPEQATSECVSPAADWYSVGVVLFEALTGALPFAGRTVFDVVQQKRELCAPLPSALVPSVPADLDALCAALLRRDPADRPRPREILRALGVPPSGEGVAGVPSVSGATSSVFPFVGRTREIQALWAAYDSVRGGPVIQVVEGVSGVGKSQLVERFLGRLGELEPDAVILSGRCYEREVVAFKAIDGIADCLASYLARLPASECASLLPHRAALLSRLFPVFLQVERVAEAPPIPDVPDPQEQRHRMFGAFRQLLRRLAERRRVVLYIDDLQWTDADSLVLLTDLLSHDDAPAVLVVATTRADDDASRRGLLGKLGELSPTRLLSLRELPPVEARELVDRLLPGRSSARIDAMVADAGGHPMLLHELTRHVGQAETPVGGTVSLEEMLGARIQRLDAGARALLETLAVAGGPLGQDVCAMAADLTNAEQVKATARLRAAHLVRTDGVRRTDRIVAYHDRVREHVDAQLGPERRRQIHERLAIALERTGSATEDPRALVRHARAAGRHALAAACAERAARSAVLGLAFDQAAELFAVAMELGTFDEGALRRLRIELATALMHAGRGPEAATHFMLAAEGAEPSVRLDCHRHAADQWIITGHLDKGMAVLASSLADIDERLASTPRRALLGVLWNRARLWLRGMAWVSRLESQVPVETLRRLDVLRAVAHGLAMIDNIRGADFNGRYLLLALATGEPRRLVGALASEVVFLASQAGRAGRRARRLHAALVGLSESCPDRAYARTWVLLADGAASFFEGRFRRAITLLERTEDVFAEGPVGLTYEKNNARVFRVHALRLLGDLEAQHALIADVVRAGRQRGDRYLETTLRLLQVHSLLARGALAEARASIDEARWTPPERGYHLQHWYELRARAELAIYEGAGAEAAKALAPSFAAFHRSMILRVKVVRADATSLAGRLLLSAAARWAEPEQAYAEVERCAGLLERERVGYATVYALLLRAGLGARAGRRAEAATVRTLRSAVEHAGENDMELHLAAARDRLGALVGGEEGAALRAAARRYATAQGVVDPERMFELIAPGCLPRVEPPAAG